MLAFLGTQHGWCRVKIGGGSSACFACVARLVLVGDGGVLGVVCWWGMLGHQRWCVGGAMVLSQFCHRRAGVRG